MVKSNTVLATAEILNNRVIIWDFNQANSIFSQKFFGKFIEEEKTKYLQLSLEEAMLLLERGLIELKNNNKSISVEQTTKLFSSIDMEFSHKFRVFSDLRSRGFIVKSGLKFGTHFRVYDRGINPYKEGAKKLDDHTKYNVHAVSENMRMSYQEWSRYVRLSQNIRSSALLGVVDEENDVTYYNIKRIKP
jgi:tRNA-intron endonuclease, archaea type